MRIIQGRSDKADMIWEQHTELEGAGRRETSRSWQLQSYGLEREEIKYSLIHVFTTPVTESLIMPFTEIKRKKKKRGDDFQEENLQFRTKETLVHECVVGEGS